MGRLRAFDEDKAVDAAVDCFWSRGYEASSVRDLAERMGIGGASLYNAFGDKRALFVRALERYADRASRHRIARLERLDRPREAIAAFFAEIIERSLADRDRKGCLLVNSALDVAPHDADIARVVAGYLDEIRAFFMRTIVKAQASSRMSRALDAAEVSGHLLGVLLGIRVLARTRPQRASLEAIARPALRLLDPPRKAAVRKPRKPARSRRSSLEKE
jgi:TetR/AcrR family transcriptional repressor of nem operon